MLLSAQKTFLESSSLAGSQWLCPLTIPSPLTSGRGEVYSSWTWNLKRGSLAEGKLPNSHKNKAKKIKYEVCFDLCEVNSVIFLFSVLTGIKLLSSSLNMPHFTGGISIFVLTVRLHSGPGVGITNLGSKTVRIPSWDFNLFILF